MNLLRVGDAMSENSWSKWSSVSEILSSLAIIITLVFLVIQTKQNTDAIDAQLVANRAEARAAIWALVSKSSEYTIAQPRIGQNLKSTEMLSDEDQQVVFDWLVVFWGTREFVWLQFRDGVVDESTYKTIMDQRILLANPRVSEWWDQWAMQLYDPDFVKVINDRYRN